MGAGTRHQGFANAGAGQGAFNNLFTNAENVYGGLEPQLAAEAAHPQGFTPQQKATINTASQQSAGGGNAGAIGAGRLYSARTRNAGGAKQAIGEATRGEGANLSSAALNTEMQNAKLQESQRQAGLRGQQGLYGTTLGGGLQGLGLSNQALGVTEYNPIYGLLGQALQSGGQVGSAALMA